MQGAYQPLGIVNLHKLAALRAHDSDGLYRRGRRLRLAHVT